MTVQFVSGCPSSFPFSPPSCISSFPKTCKWREVIKWRTNESYDFKRLSPSLFFFLSLSSFLSLFSSCNQTCSWPTFSFKERTEREREREKKNLRSKETERGKNLRKKERERRTWIVKREVEGTNCRVGKKRNMNQGDNSLVGEENKIDVFAVTSRLLIYMMMMMKKMIWPLVMIPVVVFLPPSSLDLLSSLSFSLSLSFERRIFLPLQKDRKRGRKEHSLPVDFLSFPFPLLSVSFSDTSFTFSFCLSKVWPMCEGKEKVGKKVLF